MLRKNFWDGLNATIIGAASDISGFARHCAIRLLRAIEKARPATLPVLISALGHRSHRTIFLNNHIASAWFLLVVPDTFNPTTITVRAAIRYTFQSLLFRDWQHFGNSIHASPDLYAP